MSELDIDVMVKGPSKQDLEIESLRTQLAKANEQLQSVCNHNATQQPEITRLRAELAKTNERVKELELVIVAITHADETGYVDDVGFVEGWSDVCDEIKALLNKFAIEKKIEGAQRVLDCGELNLSQGDIDTIRLIQEQLRKEQE